MERKGGARPRMLFQNLNVDVFTAFKYCPFLATHLHLTTVCNWHFSRYIFDQRDVSEQVQRFDSITNQNAKEQKISGVSRDTHNHITS